MCKTTSLIQQQVVSFQNNDLSADGQSIFGWIVKKPVIYRPAAYFTGSNPLYAFCQVFQVKSDRSTFDFYHGNLVAATLNSMTEKILLPSVETIHSDCLNAAQIVMLMREVFQKAEQRAFAGTGRCSQHNKNTPFFFFLNLCQFPEQWQKDLLYSSFTV